MRSSFTCVNLELTSRFNSWSIDFDPAGVNSWVHLESGGELRHRVSSVVDGDGVHAVELGDVGDGVSSVTVVLDVNFGFGSGVRDDLDGELGFAGFGAVHREGPGLIDFASLQTGATGRHLVGVEHGLDYGFEGRPGDVLVGKQDVDGVLTRLSGQVRHGARSVTVVLTFYLGLTGPLHCQAQTTSTSSLCVDGKGGWFTHNTTLKSWTISSHLEGSGKRDETSLHFKI